MAPPPSTLFPGTSSRPTSSGAGLGGVFGSSNANGAGAGGAVGGILSNNTIGQDTFPFAPPLSFNEADYSWLFDGLDPFEGASAAAAAAAGGMDAAGMELAQSALDSLGSGAGQSGTGLSTAPTPLPAHSIGEGGGTRGARASAAGIDPSATFPSNLTTFSPVSSDGIGPGPAFPPEARTPTMGGTLLMCPAPPARSDASATLASGISGGVDGSFALGSLADDGLIHERVNEQTHHASGDGRGKMGEDTGAQNYDAESHGTGPASVGDTGPVDPMNALNELVFFASLQAEIPNVPAYNVDSETHAKLLRFLVSVQELHTSTLFAPSALQCYIFLFFKHVNTVWPLIHKPTFDASKSDPMLLSAIIVNGMHFGDTPSHELAARIGQKLWGTYVSLDDFRPARATLPMLQALLLSEYTCNDHTELLSNTDKLTFACSAAELFGKQMSNRPQHEMGHLFHNFTITLARRNAVFSAIPVILPGPEGSERQWRAWAREEEKKRIALFAFMLDSSHGALFRHIPALSAFQIQLQLPCHEDEWIIPTAEDWHKYRQSPDFRPSTSFLTAVKASLSSAGVPPALDTFSKFVLLHGLISIAFDLQWKQVNVLMGADAEAGVGNWRERISAAVSLPA